MATLTVYPDPDPESTSVDGRIYKNAATYAGAHDAAVGGNANDSAIYTDSGWLNDKVDAGNWNVSRIIWLFDTSSLGSTAIISAATLSVMWQSSSSNGDSESAVIVSASPASNTAITTADFDKNLFGTTAFSTITYAAIITAGVDVYTDWVLNASGITNISKTGVSKFGGRPLGDINNTTPAGRNYIDQWYSADNTGTTKDPKLVITYTYPTSKFQAPNNLRPAIFKPGLAR